MDARDEAIFKQFATTVRQQFPDARVWAFGSRVNGTATEGSDLDVCVVLNTLNHSIDHDVMKLAWQIGFDHNLLISPVTYSTEEFERGPCSQSSLVYAILGHGVKA
jgi:uncharacterized protein